MDLIGTHRGLTQAVIFRCNHVQCSVNTKVAEVMHVGDDTFPLIER